MHTTIGAISSDLGGWTRYAPLLLPADTRLTRAAVFALGVALGALAWMLTG